MCGKRLESASAVYMYVCVCELSVRLYVYMYVCVYMQESAGAGGDGLSLGELFGQLVSMAACLEAQNRLYIHTYI